MAKHKVPAKVNAAQRTLRHKRASKLTRARARGVIRNWNRKAARKTKHRRSKLMIRPLHTGILQVPTNKSVNQLPLSHFVRLARRKGLRSISLALGNLRRWNKNKKPSLSHWAARTQRALSKKVAA